VGERINSDYYIILMKLPELATRMKTITKVAVNPSTTLAKTCFLGFDLGSALSSSPVVSIVLRSSPLNTRDGLDCD
jgi:hypothetical protein